MQMEKTDNMKLSSILQIFKNTPKACNRKSSCAGLWRRRVAALAAPALLGVSAWAYTVTGTVSDYHGEGMPDATVRLLAQKDSAFVTGTLSDTDGHFRIADVNAGRYILEATYVGYNKGYKNVRVQDKNVKIDTIRITESSVMLKETTVIGVKTPIRVMQDTIEFNADTYKTQPNSVVEDLLKRLPGVEVGSDGKITANGKEVTKILVDGKEFFADDPKVASKNLPVSMVDKLQVVDRKSDLARLTGVDDGEEETVINLTVKKGMKNGWFGTVEAGYGTDDRYVGTFNINRFWNDNQLTFIGNANNTNQMGFTDGNGSRFRRFGGDNGINNSQQFGVNFNVGNKEIFRVGGNVMYSHSSRDTRQRSNKQYLMEDSTSYENSRSNNLDKGHNIRADFRIQWKPDSFNTFDFRPQFSYNHNNSTSLSTDTLMAGAPGLPRVNRSYNDDWSKGNSYEASGRLIFNHNFASHRGRSISLMANYRFSDVKETDNDFSHNVFYRLKDALGNDSIDSYEQLTDGHTWSNNVEGRLTWTEPIGNVANGNFITAAYRINYKWNNADNIIDRRRPDFLNGPDDLNAITWSPWEYIDTLSNSFRNNFFNQEIRLGYKKVSKMMNLELGVSAQPSMSKSTDLINSARNIRERWVWNFAPFLRFRYRFDKQSSIVLNYRSRSSQPSMTQLQPVPDYSNPLNVVIGNPELKPSFTHNIMLRFMKFNPDRQSSIMSMLDAQITQNSVISHATLNSESGGRVTRYENANGVWSIRGMNMYSQPFGSSKQWSFNNAFFINYNQSVGYNNGNFNRSGSLMFNESPSIAFRPANLELELRPRYSMQATFNSLKTVKTSTVHTYGGMFNGTYYTPWGIVLATDLDFSATKGYAAGYDNNQWMWNASISYQFLPGQAATVMLKVYDLLQQKQSVSRSVSAMMISDTEYNNLTRYFMLTFTYRFNTFGKGQQPSDRNRPNFGPGAGGPPGPPPGGMGGGRRGGGPML